MRAISWLMTRRPFLWVCSLCYLLFSLLSHSCLPLLCLPTTRKLWLCSRILLVSALLSTLCSRLPLRSPMLGARLLVPAAFSEGA